MGHLRELTAPPVPTPHICWVWMLGELVVVQVPIPHHLQHSSFPLTLDPPFHAAPLPWLTRGIVPVGKTLLHS